MKGKQQMFEKLIIKYLNKKGWDVTPHKKKPYYLDLEVIKELNKKISTITSDINTLKENTWDKKLCSKIEDEVRFFGNTVNYLFDKDRK